MLNSTVNCKKLIYRWMFRRLTVFSHGPSTRFTMLQLLVRQMMTDLSSDWVAKKEPMGSQVKPFTRLSWPLRTARGAPVEACHIRTVLSKLQLASCVSSGDHPRSTYFMERTNGPPNVQFSAFTPNCLSQVTKRFCACCSFYHSNQVKLKIGFKFNFWCPRWQNSIIKSTDKHFKLWLF